MFVALASLIQNSGKLSVTLFPGPDGRLKVCVAPSAEKGKEAALATPLTLTATPEELDEGFAGAIAAYQASRTSLAAQIEATTAVLNEAKKSQSSKAVKALDKAAPATSGTSAPADKTDEDEEETDVAGTDSASSNTAPAPAESSASPASGGTDLLALI